MTSIEEGVSKVFGIFAVIGIGLGASGALVISAVGGGDDTGFAEGIATLQAIGLFFYLAPIVAAIAGVYCLYVFESKKDGIKVAASGSFIGFYIMFFAAFLIMSLGISGGGGGGGSDFSFISDNIVQIGLLSLPSTIVGGLIPALR
jgi:hypothetical protein